MGQTEAKQYIIELTRAQAALDDAEKHLRAVPVEVLRDATSSNPANPVQSRTADLYTKYFPKISQIIWLTKEGLEPKVDAGA